jgi:hypothetical protein
LPSTSADATERAKGFVGRRRGVGLGVEDVVFVARGDRVVRRK